MLLFFMTNSERFYILEVGGKQIRCKPGENILVDRIDGVQEGDKVSVKVVFDTCQAVNTNVECVIESPLILGKKIRIYKMKRRKGFEKTIGFRGQYTIITVGEK